MNIRLKIRPYFLLFAGLASGCTLTDDSASKKLSKSGLIATPASYYSTPKARYLGTRYKDNLDRLTERIVRNSNTSHLQFANNISSVGGIGFFTHSATKTSDERYLEVVLATPENFETKGEYGDKVNQLFSRYGQDLLGILAGDNQIQEDKELTGYGLNLTWRNVISEAPANRVTTARAIIYFHKDRVANFLRRDISQNELLRDAVIFAMEEDGPMNLVSYQARETKPDFRPAIREDNLAVGGSGPMSSGLPAAAEAAKVPNKSGLKGETAQKAAPAAQATKSRTAASQPTAAAEKPELKAAPAAAQKDAVPAPQPEKLSATPEKSPPTKREPVADKLALAKPLGEAPPVAPVVEANPEAIIVPRPSAPAPAVELRKAEPIKTPPSSPAAQETKSRAVTNQQTAVADKSEVKAAPAAAQKDAVPAPQPEKVSSAPEKSPPTKREPVAEKLALAKPLAEAPPVAPVSEANPDPITAPPPSSPAPTMERKAEPIKTPPSNRTNAKDFSPSDNRVQPGREDPTSTAAPLKKVEVEPRPVKEPEKPTTAALVAKPADEAAKTKPAEQIKKQETIVAPAPSAKLPAPARPAEEKLAAPPASAAKAENRRPVIDPVPLPVAPTSRETEVEKATESLPVPAADSKASEVPRPLPETLAPPLKAKASTPRETKPAEAAMTEASQEKNAEIDRADAAMLAKNAMPKPDLAKSPEIKAADATAVRSAAEKSAAGKIEAPTPTSAARDEERLVDKPPMAPAQEKAAERPLPEQVALLKKPIEPMVDKKPLARPAPQSLEGFIIQIAFNDKNKAQGWAEKMAQRGYAVSVTEAGAEGSLRVRLGNFSIRDDAERQLRNFKQEGMSGIIINLPQAFRPEARSSMP